MRVCTAHYMHHHPRTYVVHYIVGLKLPLAIDRAHWFSLRLIIGLTWQLPRKIMPRPSKHPDFWVDSDECLARSKKRLMPHSIPSKPHFFTSKLPQHWAMAASMVSASVTRSPRTNLGSMPTSEQRSSRWDVGMKSPPLSIVWMFLKMMDPKKIIKSWIIIRKISNT